jgi:hypothetical protein
MRQLARRGGRRPVATRGLVAVALGASIALSPGEGAALTSIVTGEWTNGSATSYCSGTTTSFTCQHVATTARGFSGTALCLESDSTLNRPLETGCGAVLLSESLSRPYQRTSGAGTRGACATSRTYSSQLHRPVVRVTSMVLSRNFEVPVDIINNAASAKVSGTVSTADGLTVHVEGHWSQGCGGSADGYGVSPWHGTFEILA